MRIFKLTAVFTAALAMMAWADPCGTISKPTSIPSLTYTGSPQSPTSENTAYTFETTDQTNADTYTGSDAVTVSLVDKWVETTNEDGCKWAEAELGEETDDFSLDWTIDKASGTEVFSYAVPNGLTVAYGKTLADVSLASGAGEGIWSWVQATTSNVTGAAGTNNTSFTLKFTPTDADNYDVVTDLATSIAITKAPGTAVPGYSIPDGLTATYGETLADVELPANWAWESVTTTPVGTVGTPTHTAKYTPADATNYNEVTGVSVSITVGKAAGLAISVPALHLYIKNDNTSENSFDLSGIALNKSDHGLLSYTLGTFTDGTSILTSAPTLDDSDLKYTGNSKTSGTATLVITISSENYANINTTITFEATNKDEAVVSGLVAHSTTYGDGSSNITGAAISGDCNCDASLVYSYTGYSTGNVAYNSATPPTNAGTYTLTVSIPAANASYYGSAAYEFTIGKASGASITLATGNIGTVTQNSIALTGVSALSGQTVEYARNSTSTAPISGWQSSPTFTGLAANTTYYIFARAVANGNYNQGSPSTGLEITTSSSSITPTPTPGDNGCIGSCSGYTKPTPVLSQAVGINNKAVQFANGLNLSVNSNAVVNVYGLKGNLVQSNSYASGNHTVSFGSLPKGMYIVKVSFSGSESNVIKMAVK